jgi:hypothetical protein
MGSRESASDLTHLLQTRLLLWLFCATACRPTWFMTVRMTTPGMTLARSVRLRPQNEEGSVRRPIEHAGRPLLSLLLLALSCG